MLGQCADRGSQDPDPTTNDEKRLSMEFMGILVYKPVSGHWPAYVTSRGEMKQAKDGTVEALRSPEDSN